MCVTELNHDGRKIDFHISTKVLMMKCRRVICYGGKAAKAARLRWRSVQGARSAQARAGAFLRECIVQRARSVGESRGI